MDLIVDLFKVAGRQCAICFFYMHLFFICFNSIYCIFVYNSEPGWLVFVMLLRYGVMLSF